MADKAGILACLVECGVDAAPLKAQAAKLLANDPKLAPDSEDAAHLVGGVFSGPVLNALGVMLAAELLVPGKSKK